MNNLEIVRTLILSIGWPVLIIGSVYLFTKGSRSQVYTMVKDSLVGKIVKVLALTMLVGMYGLGIVTTAYLFDNVVHGVAVGLPVFVVWFITFAWAMKTLVSASNEVRAMGQE